MNKSVKKQLITSFLFSMIVYAILYYAMATKMINNYWTGILITAIINVILASSLNLASGFLGQLTLGHAGFMSIGAYVCSLCTLYLGTPFILNLILGSIVAGCVGFLIGIPTLRLKGDYLCIITLAFNEIIRVVLLNIDITNGARGLLVPKETSFTAVFFSALITIYVIYCIVKSRQGRAIVSIREDEIASELAGIPVSYFKTITFAISAFFAGLAGGLYAHYITIITPSVFDYNKSVEILVMVVIGGLGSIKGAIIAAIVMTVLPEYLRAFSEYRMLLYAIVLIVAMIAKEKNLVQTIKIKLNLDKYKSKLGIFKSKKEGVDE
ncbi:branched-chain amino acid ABC transporter permease [Tannockella kyphosi]|uniref:branched-chain amino acid ABC transporter permease n=1 Tax=Tannockella kyphosi TaxID=2899121 RepID=UPI002011CFBE|nr:branched-chain amino acid ABC transporter permease [Tannockella kyphosi]